MCVLMQMLQDQKESLATLSAKSQETNVLLKDVQATLAGGFQALLGALARQPPL